MNIKKINYYFFYLQFFLVLAIFFFVPLAFGDFLNIFGGNYNLVFLGEFANNFYGYEKTKVYLFEFFIFILSISSIIFFFLFGKNLDINIKKKSIFYLIIFYLILFFGLFINENNGLYLYGNLEKKHGLLFFISLFLFGFFLYKIISEETKKKIIYTIFISFFLVFIYSSIQFLGFDYFLYEKIKPGFTYGNNIFFSIFSSVYEKTNYDYSFLKNRIFSSFGNPNYLAGYSLILLPLIGFFHGSFIKIFLYTICILTIFMTGSVFGIFLAFLYLLYKFLIFLFEKELSDFFSNINKKLNFKESLSKYNFYIFGFIGLLILIFLFFQNNIFSPEKSGSMIFRINLFYSIFLEIINNPKIFFFGNGFDSLSFFIENNNNIKKIISDGFTTDRSHNLFLDIFFHNGIFALFCFIYFLYYLFVENFLIKKTNKQIVFFAGEKIIYLEGAGLFLLFFSLNPVVLSNYIIFIFFLVSIMKK